MYQQLQNLAQTVDTTIEDILAQTGLSEEELMAVLWNRSRQSRGRQQLQNLLRTIFFHLNRMLSQKTWK